MSLSTFLMSDTLALVAQAEQRTIQVSGIDDVCNGVVISSDKSLADFLAQHSAPLNFVVVDGEPIRIIRRPINDALTYDYTINQSDCIKPSKDGPVYLFKRPNPADLPGQTVINYFDVDREFASTQQDAKHRHRKVASFDARASFSRFGEPIAVDTRVVQTGTLDFILSADQARQIAFDWHYRTWTQAPLSFVHTNLEIEAGDTILFEADAGEFSLIVVDSTITPDRLNKLDCTVLLTSSGLSISGGASDRYLVYRALGVGHAGVSISASAAQASSGAGSAAISIAASGSGIAVTTPNFVNNAAISGATSGTTATAALPAVRPTGNLLIAYCQLPVAAGGTTITEATGWTIFVNEHGGANGSVALAYRFCDGTEAQPSFSWSGSTTWHCRVQQYTHVNATTPIGATNHANGNSNNLTAASITNTYSGSLAVAMLFAAGGFGTPALPSGYANEVSFADDSFATDRFCDQALGSAGSSSTAISITGSASRQWQSFVVELHGA